MHKDKFSTSVAYRITNVFNTIFYFGIGGLKLLIHTLNRIRNSPRNMSSYPGVTY